MQRGDTQAQGIRKSDSSGKGRHPVGRPGDARQPLSARPIGAPRCPARKPWHRQGWAAGCSGWGGVAYLLFFSTLSVAPSPSLNDKRNGPIRLRENLWATGHFMGKKSVLGSSQGQEEPNSIPESFRPVLKDALEDVKDLLTGELLKILLQEKVLEENQGKRELKEQETPSFAKLLAKYI